MHCCGHSDGLRRDVAAYFDMTFNRCTEEEMYLSRLALIMQNALKTADNAPDTHGLKQDVYPRPIYSQHISIKYDYWRRDILFEQRFSVRQHAAIFVRWHCVDSFGITSCVCESVFVSVASLKSLYEESRLLVGPTLMIFFIVFQHWSCVRNVVVFSFLSPSRTI